MKFALIGTTAGCVLGFRAHLIELLSKKGIEVYVFALDYDEVSRKKVVQLGGVPVQYRFTRSGLNPFDDLWNMFLLSRQLKQLEIDQVFSYFSKPVIFGTLAAKIAGVKSIYAMLEGLGYVFTEQPEGIKLKTKLLKLVQVFLYRHSFSKLDGLILLNKDDKVDLIDHYKIQVKHVSILGGIGLDIIDFPYTKPDISIIKFLFVGRLLAEKGINEFIEAAKKVKELYPNVEFNIIGGMDHDNPGAIHESELEPLVNAGIVQYFGIVEDVQKWLSDSSVFVLPSYREGISRSTQEAMSSGRAVITTDVPGCRDTVVDGVNGFIVPPWQADAIAEKMIGFIENHEMIIDMGKASRVIAEQNYDVDVVNQRLLTILGLSS